MHESEQSDAEEIVVISAVVKLVVRPVEGAGGTVPDTGGSSEVTVVLLSGVPVAVYGIEMLLVLVDV